MEYGEEDRLVPRAQYNYSTARPVVLAIVEPGEGAKETAEADYVAGEIEALLSRGATYSSTRIS